MNKKEALDLLWESEKESLLITYWRDKSKAEKWCEAINIVYNQQLKVVTKHGRFYIPV